MKRSEPSKSAEEVLHPGLNLSLSDLDYHLPPDQIAFFPAERRDESRLLVAHRKTKKIEDMRFKDIGGYLNEGDVLVVNDSKVLPASVSARKTTGGEVSVLFLGRAEGTHEFLVLTRPALKEGQQIGFEGPTEKAVRTAICLGRDKAGLIKIRCSGWDVNAYLRDRGKMPLPPYIKRESQAMDRERYQTVYAQEEGSVAAPTAGLHFTPDLLDAIKKRGVLIASVTLHVGYGTFKPIQDLQSHRMHAESFELSEPEALKINEARRRKSRIIAVGTTAARVLETCVQNGELIPGKGETNLFIYPPQEFEMVDALLTNFHQPKTTLLLLVAAFMGHAFMKEVYRHAIDSGYRFYSYGDATLVF